MSREKLNDIITFTEKEIKMIRTTWNLVAGSIQVAINCYNQVFYNHPHLRALFKGDIRFQAKFFTDTMTELINNIDNWETVTPFIERLGQRHKDYKVQSSHYPVVQKFLVQELAKALPKDWNKEVEAAWTKFFSVIAKAMMKN